MCVLLFYPVSFIYISLPGLYIYTDSIYSSPSQQTYTEYTELRKFTKFLST